MQKDQKNVVFEEFINKNNQEVDMILDYFC